MYRLSFEDYHGASFFTGRSDVKRCPQCREFLAKWDEDLSRVPLEGMPNWDLAASVDGVDVVSRQFKDLVERHGLTGLVFHDLSRPGLYWVRPAEAVRFDPDTPGLTLERRCPVCGRYETVVGALPLRLLPPSDVEPNGFARTDLEFGSGDEKSPVVVCGDAAAVVLRNAKLRGLTLVKVK